MERNDRAKHKVLGNSAGQVALVEGLDKRRFGSGPLLDHITEHV